MASRTIERARPLSLKISLPVGFQPDKKTQAEIIKHVDDPEQFLANFVDHYASRPQDRRTLAGWQATLRKWARTERKCRDGPQLALMRPMEGGRTQEGRRDSG